MKTVLDKEMWVFDLYTEAARQAIHYTPQLFVWSEEKEGNLEPLGSAVLFRIADFYYLITAAHCIMQNGKQIKIGILDNQGKMQLIRGSSLMKHEDVDLAAVKLSDRSIKVLLEKYKFLDVSQVMFNKGIKDEEVYLIVGYPITKTKVDNKRKRISHEAFVYISKSKAENMYVKLGYSKEQNTLLGFNQRRSTFTGSTEMNMSPEPKGVSGGGLWFIQSYDVAKKEDVTFLLCGIMIEHDKKQNMMIATKTEALLPIIQSLHNLDANNPSYI